MVAKVSIITASYNYSEYIKETIESVIKQTCPDWEMIIVDDGSTDGSVDIIESYCKKDSRIQLYTHENRQNKGLAETLKLGISKAQTNWICFLESDDTIVPDCLEKKLKIAEQYPNTTLIFNDIHQFGDQSLLRSYKSYIRKQKHYLNKIKFPSKLLDIYQKKRMNIIPTFSCVMIKKDVLQTLDFKCPVKNMLDYYLWLQLAKNHDFYYIDEKLTNWRMHGNSYINSEKNLYTDYYKLYKKRLEFLYNTVPLSKNFSLFLWYKKRRIKEFFKYIKANVYG